jgi:glutamate carboxypeptidase
VANVELTELEQQILKAVDAAFESKQLPWLQRLVNQPSHTKAREDVDAAATIIADMAARLGMRRTLFPDPDGVFADHLIFSLPGTNDDDHAIALVGHCDTVYPRSLGFLEFRRDGAANPAAERICGPGVLDMKSGLSVILFGLRALAEVAPEVFTTLKLRFICNTDEEMASASSSRLFETLAPRTTAALVFEAGREEDRIVTSRKGTGTFELAAVGQEAHSGNAHAEGINAIHALATVIPHIEELTDYAAGTTVNVGVMQGGTAKNTVPARADCVIDVRVSTLDQMQHVETTLQEIAGWNFDGAAFVPERIRQAELVLSGGICRPPMETTPESDQLREAYEVFAGKAGLGAGAAPMQGGGSDANNLAALGVPTIDGLGPYGKFMHSPREWCSVDSLRRRTAALACFLASQ